MKRLLFLTTLVLLTINNSVIAQSSPIQWQYDTLASSHVNSGQLSFINNIKGGGNPNATQQVNLDIDKLKFVVDACKENGMTRVSFILIKIMPQDLGYYRRHNPGASDAALLGSQVLVIKVPRKVFAGAAASSIFKENPLMLSLAAAGIIQYNMAGIPFGSGDLYLSFGGICPPPASCDTF